MRYAVRRHISRSPDEVFDFIGTNLYQNHPRWEREVLEIRPLTPGPVRLGSRAVMVREDFGRRSETEYEVVAFEPGRRVAVRQPNAAMLFELEFALAPAANGTDFTVSVHIEPRGALRLLGPILGIQLRRTSHRLTDEMIRLVEAAPRVTPAAELVPR